MKFIVRSYREMRWVHQDDLVNDVNWAVVSVSHNDDYFPRIVETDSCKGVLRVKFADIDTVEDQDPDADPLDPTTGYILFNKEHAASILEFVKLMEDASVDLMVVHCLAGWSRSPAIAAALAKVDGQKDDIFFKQFSPNMHVYKTLLETYHKGQTDGGAK